MSSRKSKRKRPELIIAFAHIHNQILFSFDPEWTHPDENTTIYRIKCKDGNSKSLLRRSTVILAKRKRGRR
ncbi:hypothetical protein DRP04_05625 [Archaeoglobales archaeon]|nr:MAG: hypothetical protein DRP04_05625 [Archaeoglobales archaeon]